jgi:hypothetical protein
MGYK